MVYIDRHSSEWQEPPKNRNLVAYCPEWNESGYQICQWNGSGFDYDDCPNDMFDDYVLAWGLLLEY